MESCIGGARVDSTLEVAALVLMLGGVLVTSPDGYLNFGDGRGEGSGISEDE
jgi:hypothetical protein